MRRHRTSEASSDVAEHFDQLLPICKRISASFNDPATSLCSWSCRICLGAELSPRLLKSLTLCVTFPAGQPPLTVERCSELQARFTSIVDRFLEHLAPLKLHFTCKKFMHDTSKFALRYGLPSLARWAQSGHPLLQYYLLELNQPPFPSIIPDADREVPRAAPRA